MSINFSDWKSIIYDFKFGFRQRFCASHALIDLTENIRQALEGFIGCGIFVDLQKALDTVDHEILLSKLDYYGIQGILNNWFKSYLSNCKQFVSINVYGSGLAEIKCGILQGSVLEPLLFLLYIHKWPQSSNKILQGASPCWWYWLVIFRQIN